MKEKLSVPVAPGGVEQVAKVSYHISEGMAAYYLIDPKKVDEIVRKKLLARGKGS